MNNFGDIPVKYADENTAKIVILPVPYDDTSTWLKGADKGPAAITEASANMELFHIETDTEVYINGIYTAPPVTENSTPEAMAEAVYKQVRRYLEHGKFIVTTGGEHSISIGAIRAHAEAFEDFCILQLDAHADLREEYEGSRFNHACVMARAKECGKIIQAGIRSMDSSEKENMNPENMFFAHYIHSNPSWIKEIAEKLAKNVYITIDLDVFDPAIMPSTGTPEPGGLSWYDVISLMRTVNEKSNITGVDIVELCPQETNKAPDFLAAKLIYNILSYKFQNQ